MNTMIWSRSSRRWPSVRQPPVELHVVGDGEYRARCEEKAARGRLRARFYGHVDHSRSSAATSRPQICALHLIEPAPVITAVLPFSTLKIPEYMACGRAVASVPSGPIERLIEDGVSGFLFPNEVSAWKSFLKRLPSREQLGRWEQPQLKRWTR